MIGRSRMRRDADEFAALVDGRHPDRELSDEMAAFLEIVSDLEELDAPAMRTEFAADLRSRLMLEAPEQLAVSAAERPARSDRIAEPPRNSPAFARLTRIAAVTCLVVGVGGGVAAASQSALPGDPLYGVKRAIERLEVQLSGSDSSRGEELVEQANTRLDEVSDLARSRPADDETTRLIRQALDSFSSQAGDGADALLASYRAESDTEAIAELREFTGQSSADLEELSGVVPTEAGPDLLDAAELVAGLDSAALDVCRSCSSRAPVQVDDTLRELANAAQNVVNSVPDILPDDLGVGGGSGAGDSEGPRADTPNQSDRPGSDTSQPGDDSSGGGGGDEPGSNPGGGTGGSGDDSGDDSGGSGGGGDKPDDVVPSTPTPSLPLPELPLPDLPTLGVLGL